VRRFLLRVRYRSIGALRDVQGFRSRRLPVPPGPALFVYGHSMAADTAVPAPWPHFVAPQLGLPLVNRATGGDIARQTALRAGVHRGRPGEGDLVLVHTGLNDVMRYGHDPALPARLGATLRRIAERLGSAGATVHVLAEVTLPRWDHHPPMDNGSAEANAAIRAEALAVPGAIDLAPGWDPATMVLPDGIHPNELGQAHLTRVILGALRGSWPAGTSSCR
jgi:lysophospholipase L1-like esterase